MDIISVMDDSLSNKIAAGEVVERPASIVKELVENSIDAHSTSIEIALEEAGLTSIRVTDNGKGMSRHDAVLAFERHATSKISNEHDLFRIKTLGFRGEALASIASVSKISLWTSDGETEGTKVQIDGGVVLDQSDAAFRKGTDMTIAQLFYNTPARLKYMKTIQTELGHTIDLVNRLALSHPHIAFKLSHHSQLILQTTGSGDQRRVLNDIYGMAVARKMVPFSGENADFKVNGFITLPEMTRASKNYMTLIVNGRWVKSYAVNQAVLDGMHTYLPIGRYPIAVINVESDPFLTDVNVHPSKQHIRISKEGELLSIIKSAVRDAVKLSIIVPNAVKKEPVTKIQSEQTTIWSGISPVRKEVEREVEQKSPVVVEETFPAQTVYVPPTPTETINTVQPEKVMEEHEEEPISVKIEEPEKRFPSLVPVGQVHGTYIIAQNEDGFYMIDQHAAQERIKYEFFRDKLSKVEVDERQMLLMPLIFHYSGNEKVKLEENMEAMHEVGVFLEEFGPSSYTVKEYPAWFPAGEVTSLIEELIEQVLTTRKTDIGKLREETAIMMSCKKSIKANHHLSFNDMEKLLSDLSHAENPYTCPHGRPVLVHFSTYEIEKMFKRVM
ncbi:DNA mismatch repair endonuclease MutL [Sporosarcina thermotolerans]|uniref:DNA mismatch repair protein MutL n=1 Tax=Sporosarcina thermotolerans TaxID=633404 RepID=A0AAW9A4C4_9BACL|nr:DNA mismatch repair endonuclease MutL [Sporosarcina thermotolerans]MDW0115657.1 DNA mismatch repair endonuclease MutL [Sporosarcina thermotolerans]WHT47058.1 DNA mismatch repair endonuclease MutL [Sporosarcina thermotolerans]